MGPSRVGPICGSEQRDPPSPLLGELERPPSPGLRRSPPRVELPVQLRLSSTQSNSPNPGQTGHNVRGNPDDLSMVAGCDMDRGGNCPVPPATGGTPTAIPAPASDQGAAGAESRGVDFMCQHLRAAGIPFPVASFTASSIHTSSQRMDESAWEQWCIAKTMAPDDTSDVRLVSYLYDIFQNRGLAPATLGVH